MRFRLPYLVLAYLRDRGFAHFVQAGQVSAAGVACPDLLGFDERHLPVDTCSPANVLHVRNGFQVFGINATGTPAQMVENESVGDGANLLFVHGAVRRQLPSANAHVSVLAGGSSSERPARRRVAKVNDGVVGGRDAGTKPLVNMGGGVNRWLTATTSTKHVTDRINKRDAALQPQAI